MGECIEKKKISAETAQHLDFLYSKIDLLNDFEASIVRDRLSACLRFGSRAVISEKQSLIISELFQRMNRTAVKVVEKKSKAKPKEKKAFKKRTLTYCKSLDEKKRKFSVREYVFKLLSCSMVRRVQVMKNLNLLSEIRFDMPDEKQVVAMIKIAQERGLLDELQSEIEKLEMKE